MTKKFKIPSYPPGTWLLLPVLSITYIIQEWLVRDVKIQHLIRQLSSAQSVELSVDGKALSQTLDSQLLMSIHVFMDKARRKMVSNSQIGIFAPT